MHIQLKEVLISPCKIHPIGTVSICKFARELLGVEIGDFVSIAVRRIEIEME